MKTAVGVTAGNLLLNPAPVPARIIFPAGNEIRSRKVVHRSNHGHVFKFPSAKCKRILEFESTLERDRAILLEVDPNVVAITEQPFRIEYSDDGVIKSMFPDLLVERRDGSKTVEEIKPAKKAAQPEFQKRIAIEREVLARHGYRLQVLTDEEIRVQPQLSNSRSLLHYRRVQVSRFHLECLRETLAKEAKTGQELLAAIPHMSEEYLLAFVSQGEIQTDLGTRLSMSNLYSLP